MAERDMPLEELCYSWAELPWYQRKFIALAMIFYRHAKVVTRMAKIRVVYLISVLLLASITGVVFFIVQGNALMSAAFGGILAATLFGGAVYLVWYYFR